jgi:hypothetical protein
MAANNPAVNVPQVQQPPPGGGTGPAAQQGAQQQAQPAPQIILLSPWDGDIDLSTKAGKSLWDEGIKPLENKFSGNGRDLVRFLADITNRAKKCKWQTLLTINNKSLLTHYGEITTQEVIAAKTARDLVPVTTLADARDKVNALMMYHFIYDSLGANPQKKLSTKLLDINQDGPLLLKVVLDQTFVATQASTFAIKERFYELTLKKYKWNVQALNQDVREKLIDLIAAGNASDDSDTMISLFRAYKTATNEEFSNAVDFWKNEWSSGLLTTAEQLMDKADMKYVELRELGTWGKRSTKDDQIIALTSQVEALKKSDSATTKQEDKSKGKKGQKGSKWKNDRSLSAGKELKKNGKTYKWCTGPGHNGTGMWVVHEPGTCTNGGSKGQAKSQTSASKPNDKQALTTILKNKGFDDDELESKVEAILAVMDS